MLLTNLAPQDRRVVPSPDGDLIFPDIRRTSYLTSRLRVIPSLSFAGVATGADGQWLLHSLVVVIIGGLGSIKGAVAGSLLYGMVIAFAPAYLPSSYTFYAIIFTFVLLALVLAVRPYGLYGRDA